MNNAPVLSEFFQPVKQIVEPYFDFLLMVLSDANPLLLFLSVVCTLAVAVLLFEKKVQRCRFELEKERDQISNELEADLAKLKLSSLGFMARLFTGPFLAIALFGFSCLIFEARYLATVRHYEEKIAESAAQVRFDWKEHTKEKDKLEREVDELRNQLTRLRSHGYVEEMFQEILRKAHPSNFLVAQDAFVAQLITGYTPEGLPIWSDKVAGLIVMPGKTQTHICSFEYRIPASKFTHGPHSLVGIPDTIRDMYSTHNVPAENSIMLMTIAPGLHIRLKKYYKNSNDALEIVWNTFQLDGKTRECCEREELDFPPHPR